MECGGGRAWPQGPWHFIQSEQEASGENYPKVAPGVHFGAKDSNPGGRNLLLNLVIVMGEGRGS